MRPPNTTTKIWDANLAVSSSDLGETQADFAGFEESLSKQGGVGVEAERVGLRGRDNSDART